MKTDKLRESQNVEDRRGQSSDSYTSGRSGRLLQVLFSSGSWKTKLVLLILIILIGGGGLSGILSGGQSQHSNNYQSTRVTRTSGDKADDKQVEFVSKVFASTEDYWTKTFKEEGLTYKKPTLVLYTGSTRTACGTGQAASGPFYCPGDNKVYLDISFYDELSSKYGAAGDFAMAYVIAHEVGHHVQNELGTMEKYARARQGKSNKEVNQLNVQLELQADYYAGAWSHYVQGQDLLDKGDIEEALTAAGAVGDDQLQKKAYGRIVPDSFTHGSSKQRQKWFNRGFNYGDFKHGDTFAVPYNDL
ncbi:KPN_02809 family neutral zinc metallopeptidase [Streptococcus catagoni]|uniref:KPN_02809 family neutral zinc metallopeptidase n=1 Tax=Streptococcus catagoni TaxID=2654874 RepID=UPI001408FC18|nr:neutral zinc metallopeptidase [Streptococcus catagoni]